MPWLVAGSGLNENQYPALLTLLNRFFRDYGDSGTYSQFLSYLDDPALKEELDESGRIHEATFDAVKRRVRGVPGGVFDQDAKPITELDHTLVRPGGLSVVPTYHLPRPPDRRKSSYSRSRAARRRQALERSGQRPDRGDPLLIGMGRGAQLPCRRRHRAGPEGRPEVYGGGQAGTQGAARTLPDHAGTRKTWPSPSSNRSTPRSS